MTKSEDVSKEMLLKNADIAVALFGTHDKNLKLLEESLEIVINSRGEKIELIGEEEQLEQAEAILLQLQELLKRGIKIGQADVVSAIKMAERGTIEYFISMYDEEIAKDRNGKPIRVKNFGQRQYVQAVRKNDIVFGIGPAGTGKTYLAVVMAIAALKNGDVQRIILTRPAVEAGEKLGFLPGDLKEKVDPYLRPIYDALNNVFGTEHTTRLMDRGVIEIAPLAYMRGRTLEDAFVILDEAQNATTAQMKMFLTRLGFGSKMIVNGDKTQIDLPRGAGSGLVHAERTLQGIKGIGFVTFESSDVVRHPVVASIIDAYDRESKAKLNGDEGNESSQTE